MALIYSSSREFFMKPRLWHHDKSFL